MMKDLLKHCSSEHNDKVYKYVLNDDSGFEVELEIDTDGRYYEYGPVVVLPSGSNNFLFCGALGYGILFFWLCFIGSDKARVSKFPF